MDKCCHPPLLISLYFSCPHKHVNKYNRKKIARRTIWRGLYRSDSYCGYSFKYLENNDIFLFKCIRLKDAKHLHCN